MASFRGGPVLTLDQKGRLTVPARFKDVLTATSGTQLVITKSADGCLAMYPLPVWEHVEKIIRAWPQSMERWRRMYVGSAVDVEIDSASRVLVPPELRAWAGLEREVMFMGVGAYFELWDVARYNDQESDLLKGERPPELGNLRVE